MYDLRLGRVAAAAVCSSSTCLSSQPPLRGRSIAPKRRRVCLDYRMDRIRRTECDKGDVSTAVCHGVVVRPCVHSCQICRIICSRAAVRIHILQCIPLCAVRSLEKFPTKTSFPGEQRGAWTSRCSVASVLLLSVHCRPACLLAWTNDLVTHRLAPDIIVRVFQVHRVEVCRLQYCVFFWYRLVGSLMCGAWAAHGLP